MSKILIKNGRVWDGEKFLSADVLTENSIVSAIKSNICEDVDFIYDASGKIVSPGLVDIHTHLKGISSDQFGFGADMCSLPFGVTAVADASSVYGDKNLLDSFMVKTCAFVCAGFKDNKAYFENMLRNMEKYKEKVVGIKVYMVSGRPDILDTKPLAEVVDFARKNNLVVMVHCTGSPVTMAEILNTLGNGDILTHSYHGGINNAMDDDFKSMHDARKRGVIIDAGFAGYVHTDFKIFKKAIESGNIPDVISTDITCASAYKRGGRYGMTMCMSMSKTCGMKEEDIFRAVTSNAAKALKKEKEWGFLSEGRCADISVFEYSDGGFDLYDKQGNHIYDEKGYKCNLTILNGEIVYKA